MRHSVAIVYDGSDPFPRLHRALPLSELRVEAVCDLSISTHENSTHEKNNVDRLVHTMGVTQRYDDLPTLLQRMDSSHLLIDIGTKLSIYDTIREVLLTRQGVKIAIPQPSAAFSALPMHRVVELFAIGKMTGGRLLATSRLLFSKAFSELVRLIDTPHFGSVAEMRSLYRCGIVPHLNARNFMIGRSAVPIFHLIFALMKEAPQLIVIVEKNNENHPPVYAVTLQFPQGTIANCMFTASRTWGDRYNQIDIGGTAGASFETDFLKWRSISRAQPAIRTPIVNDDDEIGTIAGAAGKLDALFAPISPENRDAQDAIVLRTFALQDALYEVLQKNDSATGAHTTITMKQIHRLQRKVLNYSKSSVNQRIAALIRIDNFDGAIEEALETLKWQ